MKQDPPSFESTMSVDDTDPVGPSSSLKSEGVKTIDPESMCQVDAAVAASKSLLEDEDDDDDDNVSVKTGASEQRDPPQMGGFSFQPFTCQPYDPLEWEALYNATVCNAELSESLEMMTHCRNPMDLLSVFNPPTSDRVEHSLPFGAYAIPRNCEYCGSETTDHCGQKCQRPKSFFRKKRPPFSPKGPEWDSETDYEIVRPKKIEEEVAAETTQTQTNPQQSSLHWMTGMFTTIPA